MDVENEVNFQQVIKEKQALEMKLVGDFVVRRYIFAALSTMIIITYPA